MTTSRRATAVDDPESAFLEPRFVVDNQAMSRDDKIKVLLDWRQDLLELQTASEENMPGEGGESNVAARLAAVTDALLALGHDSA